MEKIKRYKRFDSIPHGCRECEIEWKRGKHVVMVKVHTPRFPDRPNNTATVESFYYETLSGKKIKDNTWGRGGIEPGTEFAQLEAEAESLRERRLLECDDCG